MYMPVLLKERIYQCVSDKNMYILFHEQLVCKMGTKIEKVLLDEYK